MRLSRCVDELNFNRRCAAATYTGGCRTGSDMLTHIWPFVDTNYERENMMFELIEID